MQRSCDGDVSELLAVVLRSHVGPIGAPAMMSPARNTSVYPQQHPTPEPDVDAVLSRAPDLLRPTFWILPRKTWFHTKQRVLSCRKKAQQKVLSCRREIPTIFPRGLPVEKERQPRCSCLRRTGNNYLQLRCFLQSRRVTQAILLPTTTTGCRTAPRSPPTDARPLRRAVRL